MPAAKPPFSPPPIVRRDYDDRGRGGYDDRDRDRGGYDDRAPPIKYDSRDRGAEGVNIFVAGFNFITNERVRSSPFFFL